MSVIMQGILGCFIGSMILIAMYAALYYYREVKFKKEMVERNKGKGLIATSLYSDYLKKERERKLSEQSNDKTS